MGDGSGVLGIVGHGLYEAEYTRLLKKVRGGERDSWRFTVVWSVTMGSRD
jgi:hypothetical protein